MKLPHFLITKLKNRFPFLAKEVEPIFVGPTSTEQKQTSCLKCYHDRLNNSRDFIGGFCFVDCKRFFMSRSEAFTWAARLQWKVQRIKGLKLWYLCSHRSWRSCWAFSSNYARSLKTDNIRCFQHGHSDRDFSVPNSSQALSIDCAMPSIIAGKNQIFQLCE